MGTRQQSGAVSYGKVMRPIGNSEKHVRDDACDSTANSSSLKDRRATHASRSKHRHTVLGLCWSCAQRDSIVSSHTKALSSMGRETKPMPPRDKTRCATTNSKVASS